MVVELPPRSSCVVVAVRRLLWALLEDEGFLLEDEGFLLEDEGFLLEDEGFLLEDEGFLLEDEGFLLEDEGFSCCWSFCCFPVRFQGLCFSSLWRRLSLLAC